MARQVAGEVDYLRQTSRKTITCWLHETKRHRIFFSSSTPPSPAFPSSSSTSNSIGSSSSSASTSRFHSVQNQSPEEHVEAARSAAASALKAAKAARALANEKALISSKAIAAAKRALELVDSFPKEAMADCKEKKHVSLDHLSSKGELRRYEETEDLARRLQRAIDRRYPKVLRTREENDGQINKKQKMNKTVVDSDSSYDGLESYRTFKTS
ncbi:suppressor protein SRP40-like [Raphanus sativus]|nr:suppressor protein SRP40-like [Raphanus sativus]